MRLIGLIAWGALIGAMGSAVAQVSNDVVRIGVINDQNSQFAYASGQTSVAAARMAVQDFGGKVLGKPIEVLSADHQNKPDVASGIVRKWADVDKVDAFADATGSGVALAIQEVAREKNKTFLIASAATSDLTGKACNETSTQWSYDTYALSNVVAREVVRRGGRDWYFITADYAFGHALERDATRFITGAGGKVLGSIKVPLNSPDFSSFLLQAASQPFSVLALATAGGDTINLIKQTAEFRALKEKQELASLLFYINDIGPLGLKAAQGLLLANSFYWDANEETRAWTKRFQAFSGGKLPNMLQAGLYAAVTHYLKAIDAAGTDEPKAVARKMRELKVNDFYNKNVEIRPDGRVLHKMFLMQVKTPEESKHENDYYKILSDLPGNDAFRSMSDGGCPLVQANSR
ncbi:MAG: ABC transporter substrate-binding protein [Xanthobacteraceae bacterium]